MPGADCANQRQTSGQPKVAGNGVMDLLTCVQRASGHLLMAATFKQLAHSNVIHIIRLFCH